MMLPLIATMIVCAALVVLYPPATLAIFVLGTGILGWAAWRKARERRRRRP